MNFRSKAAVIIILSIVFFTGIVSLLSKTIIMKAFHRMEEKLVLVNLERAGQIIQDRVSNMSGNLADWSSWDATYAFIQGKDPEYIKNNIFDKVFDDLQINFIVFVDLNGKAVYSRGYDYVNKKDIPLCGGLEEFILSGGVLDKIKSAYSSVSGIMILEDDCPVLLAVKPILSSDYKGPVAGTLVFGKCLTQAELQRMGSIIHVKINLEKCGGDVMPDDCARAKTALMSGAKEHISVLNKDEVAGYVLLNDIRGEPSVMLRAILSSEVVKLGKKTIVYFIVVMFCVALIAGALVFIPLETEISRRERDERTLRHNLKRFSDIAMLSETFIWEVDKGGMYTYASPLCEKILGYKPEELVGKKHFYDLFTPETKDELKEAAHKLLSKGMAFRGFLNLNVHKSGRIVLILTSFVPVLDQRGEICGYRGVDEDVTERKQIEDKLFGRTKAMEIMTDNIPGVIYEAVVGPGDGIKFKYLSAGISKLVGLSADELVHDFSRAWRLVHKDDAAQFMRAIGDAMKTMDPLDYKFRINAVNGGMKYLVIKAVPRKDESIPGTVVWTGIFLDVTQEQRESDEKKALYSQFEKEKEELKQSLAQLVQAEKLMTLGELTAGIAHELNQPLNVIMIIAQTMLRGMENKRFEQGQAKDDLHDIVGQVNRMAEIVKQMRIFTRASAGDIRSEQDINRMMCDILKLIRQQYINHNIELKEEYSHGLPGVMVDPIRIEQVFLNLMNNARYAVENSRKDKMSITIKTYAKKDGEEVVLEISDNGIGIPDEVKGKILQPFFTTKDPGKGTGLGLSVSAKIVEEAGGRIEFESVYGQGAAFRVVLPAVCARKGGG